MGTYFDLHQLSDLRHVFLPIWAVKLGSKTSPIGSRGHDRCGYVLQTVTPYANVPFILSSTCILSGAWTWEWGSRDMVSRSPRVRRWLWQLRQPMHVASSEKCRPSEGREWACSSCPRHLCDILFTGHKHDTHVSFFHPHFVLFGENI